MKRILLVGLFAIALLSMLCIGFALGAVFSPAVSRTAQSLQQRFFSSRDIPEPRSRSSLPEEFMFIQEGVSIVEIVPGSPADQAGLEAGERIVSLNGKSVEQPAVLIQMLSRLKPGDSVTVEVAGPDGTRREVKLELGEHPEREGYAWMGVQVGTALDRPNVPGGDDFEQMPALPPGFHGNLLHPGVLIREVVPGSPAEQAGLKTGQFIQAVDGVAIDASNNLAGIIAKHQPGDTVTLAVINPGELDGQVQEVEVKLGENPDKAGAAWLGIRFSVIDIDIEREAFPEG